MRLAFDSDAGVAFLERGASVPFEQRHRLIEQRKGVARLVDVHREQLTEAPRAGKALAQTEHMTGDVMHRATVAQVMLNVGSHIA